MKESIIFLHGILGNKNVFTGEKKRLKSQYNCISYDFYDSKSLRADVPLSLELLVDDLYALYQKNGIKKAHLCALSLGCTMAMAFAKEYPDKVISLTFIGGYYCNAPSNLHTNLILLLEEKGELNYQAWLKRCASLLNPNKKHIPEDSEAIFAKSARLLHPNVFEKVLRLQFEFDTKATLIGKETPILWVMGEYDDLYKGTLSSLKQDVPHVEYKELKNAGHVAHIHQPELFMSNFQSFLKSSRVILHNNKQNSCRLLHSGKKTL